jgi:hypothetical protein
MASNETERCLLKAFGKRVLVTYLELRSRHSTGRVEGNH